mmetsp:Transcript_21941/g.67538  ORF Transcript_21941/g.67538 Transcript_21941/m.67538 type:complete len:203 (+) Transcript_21941:2716-3324(+)
MHRAAQGTCGDCRNSVTSACVSTTRPLTCCEEELPPRQRRSATRPASEPGNSMDGAMPESSASVTVACKPKTYARPARDAPSFVCGSAISVCFNLNAASCISPKSCRPSSRLPPWCLSKRTNATLSPSAACTYFLRVSITDRRWPFLCCGVLRTSCTSSLTVSGRFSGAERPRRDRGSTALATALAATACSWLLTWAPRALV